MRGLFFGLAIGAAALSGASEAATVSFSGSSSDGADIELSQFNTMLGTLTGVSFSLRGSAFDVERKLAFDGQSAAVLVFASLRVSFAGLTFLGSDSDFGGCTAPLPGICVAQAAAQVNLDGSDFVASSDFGLVSGLGTVLADVLAVGDSSNVSVSVTYTYDVAVSTVPLPASGGMLLAGLGALALRRRRAA